MCGNETGTLAPISAALAQDEFSAATTSYRHKEPEHLSPNFVWAVRYAQTIAIQNFNPCVRVLYACNLYSPPAR